MLRVVVVDDSSTARRQIVGVLEAAAGVHVVGEGRDGFEAIDLCRVLRPDVLTLDMQMPRCSGLEATRQIMTDCPTPILILSASTNRGDVLNTCDALAAGAVDVLHKLRAGEDGDEWARELTARVKLVARILPIGRPSRRATGRAPRSPSPPSRERPADADRSSAPRQAPSTPRVVAIGASTGGPVALAKLVAALPADFPLPVLVVLHIGELFAATLAEWLGRQSNLPVRLAEDGEPLPGVGEGRVLMAPPRRHMTLAGGALRFQDGPERNYCRPSVDVLFESVAVAAGSRAIGCLLTGMGRDGAQGLLAIRGAGGRTIAQDEASSVVYGMPREAARLGAAEQVLALDAIPHALVALAAGRQSLDGGAP